MDLAVGSYIAKGKRISNAANKFAVPALPPFVTSPIDMRAMLRAADRSFLLAFQGFLSLSGSPSKSACCGVRP